jgi:RNA polymerase sigma factor for flagellar operon FliA
MGNHAVEGKKMVRSETEVERLVRDNQKLVQHGVNRYLKRYFVGGMEREDLVSWGLIGLVNAARAWDPERACSFSTLACTAIERMIHNGVRREWKPEQAAVTVSLDGLVDGTEDAVDPPRFIDRIADEQNLEQELLDGEGRAAIRRAVEDLPPAQRRLIERRFYEEVPIDQLGEDLGVSRQGVFLRQRKALRQLRAALAAEVAGGSPR